MFRMFITASHSSKHFAYKKWFQSINTPEIVFSATLGEEHEAERLSISSMVLLMLDYRTGIWASGIWVYDSYS